MATNVAAYPAGRARRCTFKRGVRASFDKVSSNKDWCDLQVLWCGRTECICLVQGQQHEEAGAASNASLRLQKAQATLQKQQQQQQHGEPPANLQATKVHGLE